MPIQSEQTQKEMKKNVPYINKLLLPNAHNLLKSCSNREI